LTTMTIPKKNMHLDDLIISIIAEYLPLRFHNALRGAVGPSAGIFRVTYDHHPSRLIEASRYISKKCEQVFVAAVIREAINNRDFAVVYYSRGKLHIDIMSKIVDDHVARDIGWYTKGYAGMNGYIGRTVKIPINYWYNQYAYISYDRNQDTDKFNDDELVQLSAIMQVYIRDQIFPGMEERVDRIFKSGNNRQFGFTSISPHQTVNILLRDFWSTYISKDAGNYATVDSILDDNLIISVATAINHNRHGHSRTFYDVKSQIIHRMYIAIVFDEVDGLVDGVTERYLRERHEAWFPHHVVNYRDPSSYRIFFDDDDAPKNMHLDDLIISIIADFSQLRHHNALRSVFGRHESLYRLDYTAKKRSRLIEASKYVDVRYKEIFLTGVINAAIADRDFAILYNKHGRIYSKTVDDIAEVYVKNDEMWYVNTYVKTGRDVWYGRKLTKVPLAVDKWSRPGDIYTVDDDDELVVASATNESIQFNNIQRLINIFDAGKRRQFGFLSRDPMQRYWPAYKNGGFQYHRTVVHAKINSLEQYDLVAIVAEILNEKDDKLVIKCKRTIIMIRLYIAITINEVDGLVDADLERFLRERHEAWFPHHFVDRSHPLYDF
jgi:hypothetical protein